MSFREVDFNTWAERIDAEIAARKQLGDGGAGYFSDDGEDGMVYRSGGVVIARSTGYTRGPKRYFIFEESVP